MSSLTKEQLQAISAIERGCSVVSLLGCVFTIVTFCSSRAFHKPIIRLVFYASFGNMMANVGTLMSRDYLGNVASFGCQFQAFLIQMFLPADALWTLAMAINVYLTFYFKFDAQRLRRMEIPYLVACYGIPLIPAFTFLFIRNSQGKRIYGNATLWCWIDTDWDILRIAMFYGPVWVVIILTFFIYIRAGRTIYERRKQLRDLQSTDLEPMPAKGVAASTTKATEVIVIAALVGEDSGFLLADMRLKESTSDPSSMVSAGAYNVHIAASTPHSENAASGFVTPIQGDTIGAQSLVSQIKSRRRKVNAQRRNQELNNAAWAYTKCAILFFTAILITWIPSSTNRVFSVVMRKEMLTPLEFISAFVLPLQGFWNAIIYAVTSWSACLDLLVSAKLWREPDVTELVSNVQAGLRDGDKAMRPDLFKSPPTRSMDFASESTSELAESRGDSEDANYVPAKATVAKTFYDNDVSRYV